MVKSRSIILEADKSDPEDRAVSKEGLERGLQARRIRMIRTNLGMSQNEFADKYGVPVRTLQEWEQARSSPPAFMMNFLKVIKAEPESVNRALALA